MRRKRHDQEQNTHLLLLNGVFSLAVGHQFSVGIGQDHQVLNHYSQCGARFHTSDQEYQNESMECEPKNV
ncbi:hypothetical protein Krac_0331 [Ktedonobacter racemifer DSM 44963]|uniref:Uncharacterized protein n=1 Tax=Ktedonobacter racemifer DSM 44963 TaxID=485913 RepID=D6U7F8_KTERA|nr:hypothetical protein Krac_0331 [Ktedonobacter racemifer DSM 44963]